MNSTLDLANTPHCSYDKLYAASPTGMVWGNSPGRLVARIPKLIPCGIVLDAGCGDGKNALFLEQHGYGVRGFDSSRLAITGLHKRFAAADWPISGRYEVRDVMTGDYDFPEDVDVLISYGLFHCLPPRKRVQLHRRLQRTVRIGGIVVFAALSNKIPLPASHNTPGVSLASSEEVELLFGGWDVVYEEQGVVTEDHLPLVPLHSHHAIWKICQRRK